MSRHKNHEVTFDVLFSIRAKQTTHDRDVANNRRAIFRFLHVLTHQSSKHDGLSVEDTYTCSYLSRAKNRLVNHIIGKDECCVEKPRILVVSHEIRECGINRADRTSVVDETFKLDNLRHKVQIDRYSIWSNDRFNLQRDTRITSFKI